MCIIVLSVTENFQFWEIRSVWPSLNASLAPLTRDISFIYSINRMRWLWLFPDGCYLVVCTRAPVFFFRILWMHSMPIAIIPNASRIIPLFQCSLEYDNSFFSYLFVFVVVVASTSSSIGCSSNETAIDYSITLEVIILLTWQQISFSIRNEYSHFSHALADATKQRIHWIAYQLSLGNIIGICIGIRNCGKQQCEPAEAAIALN